MASINMILQHQMKQPVAPVVDTQTVAGSHQSLEELSIDPDASVQSSHTGAQDALYMHTRGSTSNVTLDAMERPVLTRVNSMRDQVKGPSAPLMRRSMSIHSFGDATSGLRASPSQMQLNQLLSGQTGRHDPPRKASLDMLGIGRMTASKPLGRQAASSIAHLLAGARLSDARAKPVVSKFSQPYSTIGVHAIQTPTVPGAEPVSEHVVSVDVPPNSVYSATSIDRVMHRIDKDAPPAAHDRVQHRYLLEYGLSGPPIDSATLSRAELTPRLESGVLLQDRDETRAQTHGLRGTPRHKLLVPDSTTTLGPNMIPFHFIHALTSTLDHALALDQAEVPAVASLLPGVSDHAEDELDALSPPTSTPSEGHAHFIDNYSMRAIAYTAQAVSVQRSHAATRRFADPFRLALGRVVRMSGYASQLPMAPDLDAQPPPPPPPTVSVESKRGGPLPPTSLWHESGQHDHQNKWM